jgi:hypothetical protein
LALLTACIGGCASKPEATRTDFLSDYTQLRDVSNDKMAWSSAELRNYKSFIIDPITFHTPPEQLNDEQRKQVADHFVKKLGEMLEKRGLKVTQTPGAGVARMRIAMTGIAKSTWWKKVHPVARATGAGTGGAAMEGEVVDSVSGKQLGAVVQTSPGSQFNLNFSTVADVNTAIDKWVEQAGKRLDELRASPS